MRHVRDNCSQFCSNLGAAAGRSSLQPSPSGSPAFASITHRSSSGGSSSRAGGAAAPPPVAAVPSGGRISKEAVGRASWTFLHALAAQYPDLPSRQQRRDVENLVRFFIGGATRHALRRRAAAGGAAQVALGALPASAVKWRGHVGHAPAQLTRCVPPRPVQIDILTRMYPCADCAKHFKEIVR